MGLKVVGLDPTLPYVALCVLPMGWCWAPYVAHTLLCDGEGCGSPAYHLYCLQPPLAVVPRGKWYCAACTERWHASEAGSRQLARALHEEEMRSARNLRRQPSLPPAGV